MFILNNNLSFYTKKQFIDAIHALVKLQSWNPTTPRPPSPLLTLNRHVNDTDFSPSKLYGRTNCEFDDFHCYHSEFWKILRPTRVQIDENSLLDFRLTCSRVPFFFAFVHLRNLLPLN